MDESPGPVIPALSRNPGTLALFTLAFFQPFWIPAQGRNDDIVAGMTVRVFGSHHFNKVGLLAARWILKTNRYFGAS